MTFYYIIWTVFFICSIPYVYDIKQKASFQLVLFIIAIVAFFVACRVDVGADWYNYVSLYNTGQTLGGEDSRFEPLFMLIIKLLKFIGLSYQGFFFVLSFLSMSIVVVIAKGFGIKNYFFVFLIYISTIFCSYQLNTIRSGLMCTCIWIAFYMKSKGAIKKSWIWCLAGIGFHYLGIVFIPVMLIIDKKYNKLFVVVTIVLSFFAMFFGIGGLLISFFPMLNDIERVANYIDVSDGSEYGITLGSLFNLSVFLFCYFKYHDLYKIDSSIRIILNSMFIVIVFTVFFNSFTTIVSRFGQVLNLSLAYIWPILFEKIKLLRIRMGLFIPVTLYLIMYYNKAFLPNPLFGYSMIVPFNYEVAFFFE